MIDIQKFYDSFKDEYTTSVRKSNMFYDEMLTVLFDYFPASFSPNNILEIGTGTGNLTLLLRERFTSANIIGIDISSGALEVCQSRFGNKSIDLRQIDVREARFNNDSFDLVVSSLTLHHLTDMDKKSVFKSIHNWIVNKGIFIFCDRFLDTSELVCQVNRNKWQNGAFERGTTEEEWQLWLTHEKQHDNPGQITAQAEWLKTEAKFSISEIIWRKYIWGTIFAEK